MTYQTNSLETPLFGDPHDKPFKPNSERLHPCACGCGGLALTTPPHDEPPKQLLRSITNDAYDKMYADVYGKDMLLQPQSIYAEMKKPYLPKVREPSIEDVEHVKQLHGRDAYPTMNWYGILNSLPGMSLDTFAKLAKVKNERIAALELQVKQLQGSLETLEAQVRQPTPKSKGEVLGAALKFDSLPGAYGR